MSVSVEQSTVVWSGEHKVGVSDDLLKVMDKTILSATELSVAYAEKHELQNSSEFGPDEVEVIKFSKPDCRQCDATTSAFDKKGVNVLEIDVTEDPEALSALKELNYLAAPVVAALGRNALGERVVVDMWPGFRPDKILSVASAR